MNTSHSSIAGHSTPPAPQSGKALKRCPFCGETSRGPFERDSLSPPNRKTSTTGLSAMKTPAATSAKRVAKHLPSRRYPYSPANRVCQRTFTWQKTPRRPLQPDKLYDIQPASIAITKLTEATTETRRNNEAFGILLTIPHCFPAIMASSRAHFQGLLRRA